MSDPRVFEVIDGACVACDLCVNVCPVEGCIAMEAMDPGSVDPHGKIVGPDDANWTTLPNDRESESGRVSLCATGAERFANCRR